MMGFDPDTDVKSLDYNFTKFGGRKAEIPEPSDDQMLAFWQGWLELARMGEGSTRDTIAAVLAETLPGETGSDEFKAAQLERDAKLRQLVSEVGKRGMENLDRRREVIAAVCDDQPSVDELKMLPYRVFSAFEGYIMGELAPEGLTAVLNL